jgi:thiol-disulfide isomerase/thioredoxin
MALRGSDRIQSHNDPGRLLVLKSLHRRTGQTRCLEAHASSTRRTHDDYPFFELYDVDWETERAVEMFWSFSAFTCSVATSRSRQRNAPPATGVRPRVVTDPFRVTWLQVASSTLHESAMPLACQLAIQTLVGFIILAAPAASEDLSGDGGLDISGAQARIRALCFDPTADDGDVVRGLLAGLPPERLAPADLVRLVSWDPVSYDQDYMELARPHLAKLARSEQPAGPGAAAVLLLLELRAAQDELVAASQSGDQAQLALLVQSMPDQVERTREILAMPAFDAAVHAGVMRTFFRSVSRYSMRGARDTLLEDALPLQRFLTEDLPFETLMEVFGLTHMAIEGSHKGLVEPSEAAALSARFLLVLKSVSRERDMLPGELQWCEQVTSMLASGWATGHTLQGPAPELRFAWTSDDSLGDSLADLRGQVVVLDFWATWCTGCVASFPRLRALQQRFADEPVQLLGVTSHQGQIQTADGWVSTAGERVVEERHMQTFMEERGVTWPVVFSEASVFDPGFEVHVLPHLAVLGKDGTVVANGVEIEELEALLEELLRDD